MLAIRLARQGKHKTPSYRVVLTEHTKPVKCGYKLVLWRYSPLDHKGEYEVEAIKSWIEKGAQPSERVAKIIFKATQDKFFEKYITHRTRTAKPTKEAK